MLTRNSNEPAAPQGPRKFFSATAGDKKTEENAGGLTRASAYVSFGGLLMNLKADPKNMQEIEIDDRLYVLMRLV